MSETEDRVYALIDVAGQQQGSVQAALDGLAAERLALQRERHIAISHCSHAQNTLDFITKSY